MPTDCYVRRRVRAMAKDERSKGRHGGEICAHGRNGGVPEGGGGRGDCFRLASFLQKDVGSGTAGRCWTGELVNTGSLGM